MIIKEFEYDQCIRCVKPTCYAALLTNSASTFNHAFAMADIVAHQANTCSAAAESSCTSALVVTHDKVEREALLHIKRPITALTFLTLPSSLSTSKCINQNAS